MKLEDQVLLSFYQDISPLADNPRIMLVRHVETGQIYVRKKLSLENREIYRLLQTQQVSGIPRIHLLVETEQELIIIEEYISGLSLDAYLQKEGVLNEKDAIYVMLQLCHTLQALHSFQPPLIHRDIKPSNVILTADMRAILIDFDAAKTYSEQKQRDTVLLGTVDHAAPEQYGFRQSDARTDIYGLGILLNFMLTSCHPQQLSACGPIARIIEICTHIDPDKRYDSIPKLEKALRKLKPGGINEALHPGVKNTPLADIPDRYHPFAPPGFRSMKIWKMILAVLGYASLLWLSATIEVEGATMPLTVLIYRITTFLILISWVAVFANYGGICDHLLLAKSNNFAVSLIGRVAWCLLIMVAFMVAMGAITGIFDPAFVQVD